jgi:hypothetical protein
MGFCGQSNELSISIKGDKLTILGSTHRHIQKQRGLLFGDNTAGART